MASKPRPSRMPKPTIHSRLDGYWGAPSPLLAILDGYFTRVW